MCHSAHPPVVIGHVCYNTRKENNDELLYDQNGDRINDNMSHTIYDGGGNNSNELPDNISYKTHYI